MIARKIEFGAQAELFEEKPKKKKDKEKEDGK